MNQLNAMNDFLGTPWNFPGEFVSPNGKVILKYRHVGEVAMGAPLSGACFLITDGQEHKLKGMFGGPAVWNEKSDKAAIPYWTENRSQKLAIIDVKKAKVLISRQDFKVIDLSKYENGIIYGIDSPSYQPKKIVFNEKKEKYATVKIASVR